MPADYVYLARTARKLPKRLCCQIFTTWFFKNSSELNFVNSIQPGFKVGDPTVQDIRALKYDSDGSIKFKVRHSDDFKVLPIRLNKKAKMVPIQTLPNLY